MSERASKQVSAAEHMSEASSAAQVSEQCERMSEQTSKWPSTCVLILGCSEALCKRRKESGKGSSWMQGSFSLQAEDGRNCGGWMRYI